MLFAGLFCATFATLLLEILDGRLLSVLTWYHLSFLAVSLAMLGMAAGAIRVFLGGQSFSGENAVRRLPRAALAFALTMAISHVVVLTIPLSVHPVFSTIGLASLTTTIVTLTIPFYFSGMIVTIVLTRTAASIGRLYAWDLAGAAFGCLAVVPALDSGWFNLSSLVLLGAAVAAASGYFFGHSLPWRHRSLPLLRGDASWLRPVRSMVRGSADWRSRTRRTVSTGCRSTRTGRIGTATRTSSCSVPDGGNRSCGAAAVCRITQSV
jgi:hypothetical protein